MEMKSREWEGMVYQKLFRHVFVQYSRKQLELTVATVNSSSHELQIGISDMSMLQDVHMYGHSVPQVCVVYKH